MEDSPRLLLQFKRPASAQAEQNVLDQLRRWVDSPGNILVLTEDFEAYQLIDGKWQPIRPEAPPHPDLTLPFVATPE